jgi:hypothetical protein
MDAKVADGGPGGDPSVLHRTAATTTNTSASEATRTRRRETGRNSRNGEPASSGNSSTSPGADRPTEDPQSVNRFDSSDTNNRIGARSPALKACRLRVIAALLLLFAQGDTRDDVRAWC